MADNVYVRHMFLRLFISLSTRDVPAKVVKSWTFYYSLAYRYGIDNIEYLLWLYNRTNSHIHTGKRCYKWG